MEYCIGLRRESPPVALVGMGCMSIAGTWETSSSAVAGKSFISIA